MALNQPAARIWAMCDDYVDVAMAHLALNSLALMKPSKSRSSEFCFDEGPEMIRISFLFPFVPEVVSSLLMQLRRQRWLLRAISEDDRAAQSVRSAHNSEQVEATFDELRKKIEPLLSSFSQVQQEIIREKFLKLDGT